MRAVWSRSDNPEEAQAARQSMLRLSGSWLSLGYMHSGSDGDDDTSSIGGWSDATFDACGGSGGKAALRAPSSGSHWHDRGVALSAALQNCSGLAADTELPLLQPSRSKLAPTGLPEVSSSYTERLKALTQSVLAASPGGKSEDGLRSPSVAPVDDHPTEPAEATSETVPAEQHQSVSGVLQGTKRSLYVDVNSPGKRRDISRALVDPDTVRGLGNVISPVYRMAECFAEMKWARDGQPEWEQPGSTHVPDGKGDSPEACRDTSSATECVDDPAAQRASSMEASLSFSLLENDIMVTSPVDDILGTEFWESMVTQDLMYLPDKAQQSVLGEILEAPGDDARCPLEPLPNVAISLSQSEHASPSYGSIPEEISGSMEDASYWLHSESMDGLSFGGPRVASALLTSHPLSDEELSSPARTIHGQQEGSPETRSSAEPVDLALISPLQDLVSSPGQGATQQQGAMTTPRRHRSHIAEAMMVTCGLHSPISFEGSPAGTAPGARSLFSPELGRGRFRASPLASPLQLASHSPSCLDRAALEGNRNAAGHAVTKHVLGGFDTAGAPFQEYQAGRHDLAPRDVPCSESCTETAPLASHEEQEAASLTAPPETSPRSAGLLAVNALCSVRAPNHGLEQTTENVAQDLDPLPLALSGFPTAAPSTAPGTGVDEPPSSPPTAATVVPPELCDGFSQLSAGSFPPASSISGPLVPDGEVVPQKSLVNSTGPGNTQLGEGATAGPSSGGDKERHTGLPRQTNTQRSTAAEGEEMTEDLVPDRSAVLPPTAAGLFEVDLQRPAEPPLENAPAGNQGPCTTVTTQPCAIKAAEVEPGLMSTSEVSPGDPDTSWTPGAQVQDRAAHFSKTPPICPAVQPTASQDFRAEGLESAQRPAPPYNPDGCTDKSGSGNDLVVAHDVPPPPTTGRKQTGAGAERMDGKAAHEAGTHAIPAKHPSEPRLSEGPASSSEVPAPINEIADATIRTGSDSKVEFPTPERHPLLNDDCLRDNAQLPAPVSHVPGKVGRDCAAHAPYSAFTEELTHQDEDRPRPAAHIVPKEHMMSEAQGAASIRMKENAARVPSSPVQRPVLAPICNTAGALPKSPARKPAMKKPSIHSPAKSAPATVLPSADAASPVVQHKSQRAMAIESLRKKSNLDLYVPGAEPARQPGSSPVALEPQWDCDIPKSKPVLTDAVCEDAEQKDPSTFRHASAPEIAGRGTDSREELLSVRLQPSAPISFASSVDTIHSSYPLDSQSVADPGPQPDAVPRAGSAFLPLPPEPSALHQTHDPERETAPLPHGQASSVDAIALSKMLPPAEIQGDMRQEPPVGGDALQRQARPVPRASGKVVVPKIVGLQATPADSVQKPRPLSLFRRMPRGEHSPAHRRIRLTPGALFWGTKKPVVPAEGFVYTNDTSPSKGSSEHGEAHAPPISARKESFLSR